MDTRKSLISNVNQHLVSAFWKHYRKAIMFNYFNVNWIVLSEKLFFWIVFRCQDCCSVYSASFTKLHCAVNKTAASTCMLREENKNTEHSREQSNSDWFVREYSVQPLTCALSGYKSHTFTGTYQRASQVTPSLTNNSRTHNNNIMNQITTEDVWCC